MGSAAESSGPAAPRNPTPWTPWPGFVNKQENQRQNTLRLQTFRFILGIGIVFFSLMVLRDLVEAGTLAGTDLANGLFLIAVVIIVAHRPALFSLLAWLVLISLFLNAYEAISSFNFAPIAPVHVLLPLLVLYGALLGNLTMSLVAAVFILGIYSFTAARGPLLHHQALTLGNLSLSTAVIGMTGLGVWFQHRRTNSELNRYARKLNRELSTRRRLNAVIFHDIRNPLGALMGTAKFGEGKGGAEPEELAVIGRMADRTEQIIAAAEQAETGGALEDYMEEIPFFRLHQDLIEILGHRLAAKKQELYLIEGENIPVRGHPHLLCNSVLTNLLTNAIKFSPRGARIELAARREAQGVRIELRDRGNGFPEEFFRDNLGPEGTLSRPGTEGESGYGLGLGIAAFYLEKMRGKLEIRNLPEGAAVGIMLPESGGRLAG